MLKRLPFKKEYWLTLSTVILLLISYELAFKKTVAAWQLHSDLNKQLTNATNLSYQPAYLERKNQNLDRIIVLYKTDTVAFRNNTISNIASIAEKENVKLSEVPAQNPLYHTDQFIIQKLDFEGDYFSLTKMLNDLQITKSIGFCRSADFKVEEERLKNDDTKKLVVQIYLETTN